MKRRRRKEKRDRQVDKETGTETSTGAIPVNLFLEAKGPHHTLLECSHIFLNFYPTLFLSHSHSLSLFALVLHFSILLSLHLTKEERNNSQLDQVGKRAQKVEFHANNKLAETLFVFQPGLKS